MVQRDRCNVTVIMPVHNEARFIAQAVASVQAQTITPTELLVVDDGSSDGSANLAMMVPGPVPVRVLRQETPKGSIAARNWALRVCTTEWVAMIDADDIWLPGKLERQFAFLDQWQSDRPVVVLGTKGRHINERGDDIGVYDPGGADDEADFDRTMSNGGIPTVGHASVLFRRRDAIDAGLYNEDAIGAEDPDLWDRMAVLRGGVIVNVSEPLFQYRKKRGGMMQRHFFEQRANFERLVENRNRRQLGQLPLSFADSADGSERRSFRTRLRRKASLYGAWCYRFGSMNIVNGRQTIGILQLAVAALLDPRRVLAGLRNRFR